MAINGQIYFDFIQQFRNTINMKLITFIVLLTCFSAINALKLEESHLADFSLKLGDIIHYNDKKGDVTITYTFNGEQKQKQYTIYQYHRNYYNFDLFIQSDLSLNSGNKKTINRMFQWGRINGDYFLVLHTAKYRARNIYQSIFYDTLQLTNLEYFGDSYPVQYVAAKDKTIHLNSFN